MTSLPRRTSTRGDLRQDERARACLSQLHRKFAYFGEWPYLFTVNILPSGARRGINCLDTKAPDDL